MAVAGDGKNGRLRDHGLQSERLLWPTKGPSKFEDEVNDLFYERTVSNQASGNPDVFRWVRVRDMPNARLEISCEGRTVTVPEQGLTMKQGEGTSPGYSIVPFDPMASAGPQAPGLIAIHRLLPRRRGGRIVDWVARP